MSFKHLYKPVWLILYFALMGAGTALYRNWATIGHVAPIFSVILLSWNAAFGALLGLLFSAWFGNARWKKYNGKEQ